RDVARDIAVHARSARSNGIAAVAYGRKRLEIDFHSRGSVLRDVAVLGDYDGHSLADKANLIASKSKLRTRRLDCRMGHEHRDLGRRHACGKVMCGKHRIYPRDPRRESRSMLDTQKSRAAGTRVVAAPLDFQAHLAALDARGLLVRIDRAINKDTELHPLVRWQFQGGLREDQRRAFLFTNVVDSSGHRYDIPVAVGALAASPQIYAVGMGRPVEEIEASWMRAIASPIPPVLIDTPACQAVVITGEELRGSGQGLAGLPVPISTPGFDAAPYLTATLCVTRDPETGIQNTGTYRAALKAPDRLGVRMAARIGGAGGY